VALAVDAVGRTLVVTARPLDHVVVTTFDPRGRRLSRQDLGGPAGETHIVAAIGRDGRAVVAWGTADGGPPETVSAAEHAREVRGGRPLLAWLADRTVRTAVRAVP
jgi:hypothetical protein